MKGPPCPSSRRRLTGCRRPRPSSETSARAAPLGCLRSTTPQARCRTSGSGWAGSTRCRCPATGRPWASACSRAAWSPPSSSALPRPSSAIASPATSSARSWSGMGYVDAQVIDAFVRDQVRDQVADLLDLEVVSAEFHAGRHVRQDIIEPTDIDQLLAVARENRDRRADVLNRVGGAHVTPVLGPPGHRTRPDPARPLRLGPAVPRGRPTGPHRAGPRLRVHRRGGRTGRGRPGDDRPARDPHATARGCVEPRAGRGAAPADRSRRTRSGASTAPTPGSPIPWPQPPPTTPPNARASCWPSSARCCATTRRPRRGRAQRSPATPRPAG